MKYIITILFLPFCIISVYSQRTVGIIQNDSNSFNGYTLIAPLNSYETYLVDNCGEIVHSWNNSPNKPGASVYLLPDGSIMRTGKLLTGQFIAGGSGGEIEQYDWNNNLIWEYTLDDSISRAHHDINILPNGNILILSWDKKTNAQARLYGLDSSHFNGDVWAEKLVEIMPSTSGVGGTIVWEWSVWDHLIQDWDSTGINYGKISQNPQLIDINFANNNGISKDYFHANGIDYNPDLDQIMISIRNYDEFWVIDHSTTTQQASQNTGGNSNMGGDILYRWGNPEAYKTGTIADKKLFGQHNPNWIPSGHRNAGSILVFNNGYNDTNQISKVQRIDPPIDSAGNYSIVPNQNYLPDSASWTYKLPVFVDFVSGVNSLPNGNILIASGPDGHIYELDSLDNLVWEYISPAEINGAVTSQGNTPTSNTLFRAYKYGTNYSAFVNRSLIPLGPIEANPLPFNCTIFGQSTSIANKLSQELDVFVVENPISNSLRIQNNTNNTIRIQIFNLSGKKVMDIDSNNNFLEIETSSWRAQLYLVIIEQNGMVFSQKIIKQ